MLHSVFLLVTTCQLMFLDDSVEIVVHVSSNYKAILCLVSHCLGIDVVLFLVVLHEPSFFLKLLEILRSLVIYFRVILACANGEVYLGFNNMIKAHLIVTSLLTRFL